MPCGVGGAGFHADAKLPRFREVDFRVVSELGPIAGGDLVDWPFGYDELEPYYAAAETLIGVAGDAGANPFASWRADPYPMPPGADMYGALLTSAAASELGYHPYRARRPASTASSTTADPRATTAASARTTDARSTRRATRSRRSAARSEPAAARYGRRATSATSCSNRPVGGSAACAISTRPAISSSSAPRTSSWRAARSRRPVCCCAPASATRRISSAGTSCTTSRPS